MKLIYEVMIEWDGWAETASLYVFILCITYIIAFGSSEDLCIVEFLYTMNCGWLSFLSLLILFIIIYNIFFVVVIIKPDKFL